MEHKGGQGAEEDMRLPKIWLERVQEGYGAEVYASWIVPGKILHVYACLENVNHYWFSEGGDVGEDGGHYTDIMFFDEDRGNRFMLKLCIEGDWYVYHLYEKGVFDALLVDVEHHGDMCEKTLGMNSHEG